MKPGSSNADWWRGGVIYQIWPRSFSDGDGDGIGDIRGVLARLDYLNDGRGGGLGVAGIWLSPIFRSPLVDFGYDIESYTELDPTFGTMADLEDLLTEAHERGIRVLLDLVPNHTSDRHPWFVESRSSRQSPKRDWYRWRDPAPDGGPPNNWPSAFKEVGPAWTLDRTTGQYFHHAYSASQPDLNWDNPLVQEAMLEVIRFWFDKGVDGFRVDVAHRLGKDPEYGDNPIGALEVEPTGPGRHDADWPTTLDYLRRLRSVADEYEGRLLVGEVYVLDQDRVISYLADGDGLHLAHNFVFLSQPWSSTAFAGSIDAFEDGCGPRVEPAWCLNNHDHPRVRSRFDFDGRGDERSRASAVMLMGLRGTIFIYQGEELGLPDSEIDSGAAVDLDGRDPMRTPIPWEPPSVAGPGAGFTSGTPWLPIGSSAETVNVAGAERDLDSTLHLYRSLIRIRNESPALRHGSYAPVRSDERLYIFQRQRGDEVVVVAVNFSTDTVPLPDSALGDTLATSSRGHMGAPDRLDPLEARWLTPG